MPEINMSGFAGVLLRFVGLSCAALGSLFVRVILPQVHDPLPFGSEVAVWC